MLNRLVEAVVYWTDAEGTRGSLKIRRSTEVRVTKGGYSGGRHIHPFHPAKNEWANAADGANGPNHTFTSA